MSGRSSAVICAAVAAATLVGCSSDGVTVNRSAVAPGYSGALYVQTSAANGTNSVLVRNSPVPAEAVVDALRGRYQSNQYRFALGPNPPDWNGYTLVLSFGGPTLGSQSLCQNMAAPQLQPPSDRTEVVGDYCYGNRLVSEATGQAPAISGPQDPRLHQLVGDVVAELFTNNPQPFQDQGSSTPPS